MEDVPATETEIARWLTLGPRDLAVSLMQTRAVVVTLIAELQRRDVPVTDLRTHWIDAAQRQLDDDARLQVLDL